MSWLSSNFVKLTTYLIIPLPSLLRDWIGIVLRMAIHAEPFFRGIWRVPESVLSRSGRSVPYW
jgi:hypothetical protein